MDFAFAPGATDQDGRLRQMFSSRLNTTLETPARATSIKAFLDFLQSASLQGGDLIVGSHASDEGFLFLGLDAAHSTLPVSYEDLEAVNTSGSIHIPAGVRDPTTSFHFKGCAIGSDDSLPFLTLLKTALDNPQQVTAPKFFHGLYQINTVGVFEYMGTDYRLIVKDPFADIPSLVAAFKAAALVTLDGTAVPDSDIDAWVQKKLKLKPATSHRLPIAFPVKIVPAAGGRKAIDNFAGQCRSKADQYTYQLDMGAAPPTAFADSLAAMRTQLVAEPDQLSTHPYPIYARYHYSTFDDFFDGQTWTITLNGTVQNWIGTHYIYTLVVPVVKPGTTDELIYNFYPVAGPPVMNFLEDNAVYDLFGQV